MYYYPFLNNPRAYLSTVNSLHPAALKLAANLFTFAGAERDYSTGTIYGCGGAQVGLVGDSLLHGSNSYITSIGGAAGTAAWHIYGFAGILRRALQAKFSQPSNDTTTGARTGGFGLMNFVQGHTSGTAVGYPNQNICSVGGTVTTDWTAEYAVGTVGLGGKFLNLKAGGAGYVRIDLGANLTDTPLKRDNATIQTHMILVGNKKSGAGTLRIDVNASTTLPATPGSGAFLTTTWAMANATTVVGARSPIYSLTATGHTAHTVRLSCPASGGDVELTGAMFFDEDLGSGIQVHQFGGPGAEAAHWSATNLAGLADFGSGYSISGNVMTPLPSANGANNCRWWITDFITNDISGRTLTEYETNLRVVVTYLAGLATTDLVTMYLPPKPDTLTRETWNLYAARFRKVCWEFPEVCQLVDLDYQLGLEVGDFAYTARPVGDPRFDADGMHLTPVGTRWVVGQILLATFGSVA